MLAPSSSPFGMPGLASAGGRSGLKEPSKGASGAPNCSGDGAGSGPGANMRSKRDRDPDLGAWLLLILDFALNGLRERGCPNKGTSEDRR
jgi:hypothetical protein